MQRRLTALLLSTIIALLCSCKSVDTKKQPMIQLPEDTQLNIELYEGDNITNENLTETQVTKVDKSLKYFIDWYISAESTHTAYVERPDEITQINDDLKKIRNGEAEPILDLYAQIAAIILSSPYNPDDNTVVVDDEQLKSVRDKIESAVDYYYHDGWKTTNDEKNLQAPLSESETVKIMVDQHSVIAEIANGILDALHYWDECNFNTVDDVEYYERMWGDLSDKAQSVVDTLDNYVPYDDIKPEWDELRDSMNEVAQGLSICRNMDANNDGTYDGAEMKNLLLDAREQYLDPLYTAEEITNRELEKDSNDNNKNYHGEINNENSENIIDSNIHFSIDGSKGTYLNEYKITVQNDSEYDLIGFSFTVTFKTPEIEVKKHFSCDDDLHANSEKSFSFRADWLSDDYEIAWDYESSRETTQSTSNNRTLGSSVEHKSRTSQFTNGYGTPTTVCAHVGCSNYIASSGNTNCCEEHSNKCKECGKYCDEDALYCIDCLTSAANRIQKERGDN